MRIPCNTRVHWLLLAAILLMAGCRDNRRALAISKVKAAAKLATTEVQLSKMIFATKERAVLFRLIKLGDAEFAARTHATVKAGIDLNEITSKDVEVEDDIITLKLPPVKVLSFEYPFTSYEVDFSITENAIANSFTIEDHEVIYRNAELDIRRLLRHMGIREATERNTRQMLQNLLYGLGYQEVNITFRRDDAGFIEVPAFTENDTALKLTKQQ